LGTPLCAGSDGRLGLCHASEHRRKWQWQRSERRCRAARHRAGKWIVGLALSGAVLGASAVWVQSRGAPVPAVPSAHVAPMPAPVLQVVPPSLESAAAQPPRFPPPATLPPSKPSNESTPTDRLSAESALLMQARAQLRSGDATAAQQTLNRLRAQIPKGMLGQEREVLAIEVLAARGDAEAARRRARAFIVAYPKSPHSPQLSRFAGAP
jgi:hypothetical protein